MNSAMYANPAVKRNIETLLRDGVKFVGPGEGGLACGTSGVGRLAETGEIIGAAARILGASKG